MFCINNILFIALQVLHDIRQQPASTSYITSFLRGSISTFLFVSYNSRYYNIMLFFFLTIYIFFYKYGLGTRPRPLGLTPWSCPINRRFIIYILSVKITQYLRCYCSIVLFIISGQGIIGTKCCSRSDLSIIIIIYYNSLIFEDLRFLYFTDRRKSIPYCAQYYKL